MHVCLLTAIIDGSDGTRKLNIAFIPFQLQTRDFPALERGLDYLLILRKSMSCLV